MRRYTTNEIDELVAAIRDGKPPKPPNGKSEVIYYDAKVPGFGIRIQRSGYASWFKRLKVNGRQQKHSFGDVREITRKIAVQEAGKLAAEVLVNKHDPQAAKRKARLAAKITFEAVVTGFLKHKREQNRRSGTLTQYVRYLTGYYFENLHKRLIDEISTAEIDKAIDRIKLNAGTSGGRHGTGRDTADYCYCLLRDLFEWAIKTDKFPEDRRNPVSKIDRPGKGPSRERVLTDEEIRRVWLACDDWESETLAFAEKGQQRAPGGFVLLTDYPRATQLLLLTGLREQEIGDLHWSEVDLPNGEILLGPHRTKSHREICNPLSDMAVEILRKVEAEWKATRPNDVCVFGRGDGRMETLQARGRSDIPWKLGLELRDTHRKILKRIQRGPVGFWKHVLDPAKEKRIRYLIARGDIPLTQIRQEECISYRRVQAIKASMEAGTPEQPAPQPMERWTMHDLRRTFRTGVEQRGVDHNIGEALVGHRYQNSVAGTYNRYDYWREKCEAVTLWQDRVRAIIAGTAAPIPTSQFGRKIEKPLQLQTTEID